MLKKKFVFVLVFALAFVLAACGGGVPTEALEPIQVESTPLAGQFEEALEPIQVESTPIEGEFEEVLEPIKVEELSEIPSVEDSGELHLVVVPGSLSDVSLYQGEVEMAYSSISLPEGFENALFSSEDTSWEVGNFVIVIDGSSYGVSTVTYPNDTTIWVFLEPQ